jgi:hypothetical protein
MAFKINGVVRIDNSGNGFLGIVTATDANITGVLTATEVDAKVSSKAISEQSDGTVDDVTGADELLLLDAETGSLLRVSVGEFVEGAGIGTILTNLDNLTVTGITTVATLKGIGSNNISVGSTLSFDDGTEIIMGDSGDFSIHHDGDHTYLDETGQGNLKLRTNNFRVTNIAETKPAITAQVTSGVELYFDGNKKIETTNTGVLVSGMLTADRLRSGDIAARNIITLGITTIQDHLEVNDSTGSGTEYNLNVKTNGSSTFGVLGNGAILLGNSSGAPFIATNDHHATSKKYVDDAITNGPNGATGATGPTGPTGPPGSGSGTGTAVPQKVAILADVKSNGTAGAAAVAGWQTRPLNTEEDVNNLVTLSNNEFTLSAGTYLIEWSAAAYAVNAHQTKLTNVTDGTTQQMGSSAYAFASGDGANTYSSGSTRVVITTNKTYKIEHYCQTANSTNGLGRAVSSGEDNIYTQVTITDLEIVGGSGTAANTNLYGTAKAWGNVAADGTLIEGTNCTTAAGPSTGEYAVTFLTPFNTDSYSVNVSCEGQFVVILGTTTTGFTYKAMNASGVGIAGPTFFQVVDNEPAEIALTTFGDVINYSGAAAWAAVAANGTLENGLNVSTSGNAPYTVTFTTPMPDANYAVTFGGEAFPVVLNGTKTVNGFSYNVYNANDTIVTTFKTSFTVHALNALPPKGGTGTDCWGSIAVDGTLEASFNVASVTKTGTGKYDVVFNSQMPTSDYSVTGSCGDAYYKTTFTAGAKTVTGFTVTTHHNSLDTVTDASFSFTVNATNATLPNTVTQEQIESAINNPGASAWGKIASNGTLNGGLNVASVTRTGEGEYDVVFVTPMPDSNYSVVACTSRADTITSGQLIQDQSATGFNIRTFNNTTGARLDRTCYFTVFATNALPPKGGTGTDSWGTVQADGTLDASFNVASVTRTGFGKYDVVFTTPMPTADYAVNTTLATINTTYISSNSHTTLGFEVCVYYGTGGSITYGDAPFSFTVNATNATLPSTITTDQFNSAFNAPTFRNILINGNLTINQRNVGITSTSVSTGDYGEDRWKKTAGGMTQIVEDGNYVPSSPYTLSGTGITTTTANSPASGDWDISTTFGDIPVTARSIQLEYGNVASAFDLRPIGTELALCQRYFLSVSSGSGLRPTVTSVRSGQNYFATTIFNPFRTTPSISSITVNESVFNITTDETNSGRIVIRFNHATGDNKDLVIGAFTADAEL